MIDGSPSGETRSSYELFVVADRRIPKGQTYWVYQLKWKDLTGQLYECNGESWFGETSFDPA